MSSNQTSTGNTNCLVTRSLAHDRPLELAVDKVVDHGVTHSELPAPFDITSCSTPQCFGAVLNASTAHCIVEGRGFCARFAPEHPRLSSVALWAMAGQALYRTHCDLQPRYLVLMNKG